MSSIPQAFPLYAVAPQSPWSGIMIVLSWTKQEEHVCPIVIQPGQAGNRPFRWGSETEKTHGTLAYYGDQDRAEKALAEIGKAHDRSKRKMLAEVETLLGAPRLTSLDDPWSK